MGRKIKIKDGIVRTIVKAHKSAGYAYVPKEWIGKEVIYMLDATFNSLKDNAQVVAVKTKAEPLQVIKNNDLLNKTKCINYDKDRLLCKINNKSMYCFGTQDKLKCPRSLS